MIVDLDLHGKSVIVIGSGIEVLRKIHGLLGQDCNIVVITNRLNRYLSYLSEHGKIKIDKTRLNNISSILDGYKNPYLVLAATNDKALNRRLADKGRQTGSFVYTADDPEYSDFSYLATINIEDMMQIGISTSGRSPIMARIIRIRAEKILRRMLNQNSQNITRITIPEVEKKDYKIEGLKNR
jgi:precorrin-2 dehydrogenase / sirohydrochlorin ferrochelatase